jgi:hypothetical protein
LDKDSKANSDLLDIVPWIGCHAVWIPQVLSVFVFAELSAISSGKVLLCSCLVPRAIVPVGKRRYSLMAMVAILEGRRQIDLF